MPAKKSNTKKKSPPRVTAMQSPEQDMTLGMQEGETKPRPQASRVLLIIPFIIAILVLILWKNKGWLIAATVNNQPVWRWDLEQRFVSRYGTQTLDEMINEQILKNEAAKQGVTVTDKDIDKKTSEIEKTLQGRVSLKDALAQQRMTMDDFRRQVELQVLIEKLTANKVQVTDKDIADYIEKNKDTLVATQEATIKQEAKNILLQQKRSETFQKFFADLKKNAKVTKFL